MQEKTSYINDLEFRKKLEHSTSIYADVMKVAGAARRLANKHDNLILHSEAITHVVNNTIPDVSLLVKDCDDYDAKLIKEMFCYIDDADICNAVYDSFYESKSRHNLIYIYNSITDPSTQARVRVLTRMLWYKIHDYEGDDNMADSKKKQVESVEAQPKKRGRSKKRTIQTVQEFVEQAEAKPVQEAAKPVQEAANTEPKVVVEPEATVEQEVITLDGSEKPKQAYAMHTDHIRVYKSSVAKTPFRTYSGDFYLWSSDGAAPMEQFGRSPITADPCSTGNVNAIIGWVNTNEV